MPSGLNRYQREGDDHFITFSCYCREPYSLTHQAYQLALSASIFSRSIRFARLW
jgi:putative transposase